MQELVLFHHYNTERHEIGDPVECLEERVVRLLLSSTVTDGSRDSSVAFELKHSSGVLQFGRLLAKRRGLPERAAAVGALLHDIYVIVEGRYRDHAHLGAPLAAELMREAGGFSDEEISQVERIVYDHSDKHLTSTDPLAELGKDADVLDSFLYPGAFDYYLLAKPLQQFVHYLHRAKKIWSELGIPPQPSFSVLDTFVDGVWLSNRSRARNSTNGSQPLVPFAMLNLDGSEGEVVYALPDGHTLTHDLVAAGVGTMNALGNAARPDVLMVWPQLQKFQPLYHSSDAERMISMGLADATV